MCSKITHFFMDFDGTLTDNHVFTGSDGTEFVRCSKTDSVGINKLQEAGVIPIIITNDEGMIATHRAAKLEISCHWNTKDKVQAMEKYCDDLSKAAFVGNDLGDLEAMEAVGFPIAVRNARPEVRAVAIYVTKALGGNGAVREAAGWIMKKG